MDSSPRSQLTPLQRDLLREFFAREQRFFLTGGAALSEFYLHHRSTDDLDFFTATPVDLNIAQHGVLDAARASGATVIVLQAYADFHRLQVQRGDEECIVDLINDRAPALEANKMAFGAIRVDTLREIRANKLCAALSRSEIRDLIDLMFLLDKSADLPAALQDAASKDAGFTPADLAWVLSEVSIPKDAVLPAGVRAEDLEAFRRRLIERLERAAFDAARH